MAVPTLTTNLLAMPQLVLTVTTGTNEDWIDSILYLVDMGGDDQSTFPQLDIHGIEFLMEVRRRTSDNEVVFRASTKEFDTRGRRSTERWLSDHQRRSRNDEAANAGSVLRRHRWQRATSVRVRSPLRDHQS